MSHLSRIARARALLGGVVLLVGLGTLAGCGDGDQAAGPGDRGKVTVDANKSTATIEGLPDGFPTNDVPIVDEKVVTAAKGQPDGQWAWSVVLQSSRAVDDLSAEVKKDYADAGYAAGQASELGDASILQFSSDKYDVQVTIARTGGTVTISYIVKDL